MAGSEFAKLAYGLDFPMFVVTAVAGDDGERSGCLVGFATQTSIDPERFLVCVSRKNHTHGVATRAVHLGVHWVPEDDAGRAIAELFGGETGDEVDKFAQVSWREGPHGVPLVDGLPNRFVGAVVARLDVGDHEGFLLEPVWTSRGAPDEHELDFGDAKSIDPGHPA